MKRDPALVSLSRDHHQTLSVALRLRRATAITAGEALAALLTHWSRHGRAHFRVEEELLFPAYAAHGDPYDPLLVRALCDHVAIRQQIAALSRGAAGPADLHRVGTALAEHVRFEERELFPRIEETIPGAELAALADALGRAEDACTDR